MTKTEFFDKWPTIQAKKFVDGNGAYWIIDDCPKSLEDDIRETEGVWICAARGDQLMMRMDHKNETTYETTYKSGKVAL